MQVYTSLQTDNHASTPPLSFLQLAGDVSHKSGSKLPLLSARPTVTLATL